MKKSLFLINLIFINSIYCWDVRFHNKTPHPINFIVKNNQAGCKNGSLLVKPKTTETFNFKNLSLPCTRWTCPSTVTANIDITGKLTESIEKKTEAKNAPVVTLQFDIGDTKIRGGEWIAQGAKAIIDTDFNRDFPGLGIVVFIGTLIAGAGESVYKGLTIAEAQCRDMTITIEGKGNKATDYKVVWQRGLKAY